MVGFRAVYATPSPIHQGSQLDRCVIPSMIMSPNSSDSVPKDVISLHCLLILSHPVLVQVSWIVNSPYRNAPVRSMDSY
jgi:hypothetical protein